MFEQLKHKWKTWRLDRARKKGKANYGRQEEPEGRVNSIMHGTVNVRVKRANGEWEHTKPL